MGLVGVPIPNLDGQLAVHATSLDQINVHWRELRVQIGLVVLSLRNHDFTVNLCLSARRNERAASLISAYRTRGLRVDVPHLHGGHVVGVADRSSLGLRLDDEERI